jgi:hypothetical protein
VNDGGWTGDPIPVEQLATAYEQSNCFVLTRCYPGYRNYCSISHCRGDQPPYGLELLLFELDAGWTRFDEAAAGDCAAKFVGGTCRDIRNVSLGVHGLLSNCPGVLVGQRAVGSSCAANNDCVTGAGCVFPNACPGECRTLAREGESCVLPNGSYCEKGLFCWKGFCRKSWQLGDACDAGDDCGNTFWCDRNAGRCVPQADAGEPCDSTGALAAYCHNPYRCNARPGIGRCVERSGEGGPCFEDWECTGALACLPVGGGTCMDQVDAGSPCNSHYDCRGESYCGTDGGCTGLPTRGAPCAQVEVAPGRSIALCASDLICNESQTCGVPQCPGMTCDDFHTCSNGLCDGGVCISRLRIGASCTKDTECSTYYCLNGVCTDPVSCR